MSLIQDREVAPWTGPSSLKWEAKATLSGKNLLNSMNNFLEILSTAFPGIGSKVDAEARKEVADEAGAEERAMPSSLEGGSSEVAEREALTWRWAHLSGPAPSETDEIPAVSDKPPD
uniref:Uncharacterized protein n=1 Tax=Amphimedon queenslandica TaxID=400682 RepID=A0A1X7USH5_AMPQE